MQMPLGKHKGKEITDIESSYLEWLEQQDWIHDDLREAINEELKFRNEQKDRPGAGRVVQRGRS